MKVIIYMANKEIKEVSPRPDSKIGELIKLATPETAALPDNLEDQEVYTLDGKDEISKDLKLSHDSVKESKAFVIHRCKKVQVTVKYGGNLFTDTYRPSKLLKHIRQDAIKKFNIDGSAGQNLELFEKADDQNSKLNRNYPIGYLTNYPACSVVLYLADPNAFAG